MLRFSLVLLLYLSVICDLKAQDKVIVADFDIVDEDTIFFSDLPEVEILAFKSQEERNTYFILKRRVIKVYPYAIVARKKLDEMRLALDTIPRRKKKKRYTKEMTK